MEVQRWSSKMPFGFLRHFTWIMGDWVVLLIARKVQWLVESRPSVCSNCVIIFCNDELLTTQHLKSPENDPIPLRGSPLKAFWNDGKHQYLGKAIVHASEQTYAHALLNLKDYLKVPGHSRQLVGKFAPTKAETTPINNCPSSDIHVDTVFPSMFL